MADNTAIEWSDATWNVVTGCKIVSPGCTNCYAMKLAGGRLRHHPSRVGLTNLTFAGRVWNGEVRFNQQWLFQPLNWTRPRRIFVAAHGDLFYDPVPLSVISMVFAVMAMAPQHSFQVLTKRSKRMRDVVRSEDLWQQVEADIETIMYDRFGRILALPAETRDGIENGCLPNVWLGVSAEDQRRADERVPDLLDTPAAVRFVSAEPLLAPIVFADVNPGGVQSLDALTGRSTDPDFGHWPKLDWIIVGGESGPRARPMNPDWVRRIRDDCLASGTAFFFKQWGGFAPYANLTKLGKSNRVVTPWPNEPPMVRVRKKVAATIDGATWKEFPA